MNKQAEFTIYQLLHDLPVFGVQVKTFPKGIQEAFEALSKMLDARAKRSYYGINIPGRDGKMIYHAVAEEAFPGEANKFLCEKLSISKGVYLTASLRDWPNKTSTIHELFTLLGKDERVDRRKPLVEWYKNKREMLCMVRLRVG